MSDLTTKPNLITTRKLDYIQAMIWARINDEVNERKIKLSIGDCYALGSVIKEILHPEVLAELQKAERRGKLELLKKDIKYNALLARYQQIYLGGEEAVLPIKKHIKKLQRQVAQLEADLNTMEEK